MMPSIVFDPLIPSALIVGLTVTAIIFSIFGQWKGLHSLIFRSIAIFTLAGALMNPQKLVEQRNDLPDIALLITDNSQSMTIAGRASARDLARTSIVQKMDALDNLEVIEIPVNPSDQGTQLTNALIEGLGQIPTDRLAGVVAITDGQVHDLPENPVGILPDSVPFHTILIGDQNARDRRLSADVLPKFGLVGEKAQFSVKIEDPGHEGESARLNIALNGKPVTSFSAKIGDVVSIPIRIEKRGTNTVEFLVEAANGEITLQNNLLVAEVSGIRDRLRVLLIEGEPHMGGRAWRNLLKSDPSVDLVQFTILTNPGEKNTSAQESELSLIEFPVAELFEDKLEEFDLIIFDQFKRRTMRGRRGGRPMLSPYYIANVSRYVENGGALLIATGPPFAGERSLARSPLIAVLPARPTGEIIDETYRPALSDKGKRHPITAIFDGPTAKHWGRWYRAIDAEAIGGDTLITAPNDKPLLVIDQVKKGRVAMLLSDQAWLWAKNHDGGGPYNEIFRRTAHWLMGEPDLDANQMDAKIEAGVLSITHKSLNDKSGPINVIMPDGSTETVTPTRVKPGVYTANLPIQQTGAYRISGSGLSTIAAAGALNPLEYENVRPTGDILAPLIKASGGGTFASIDGSDLPSVRKIKKGAKASGDNFAGLNANGAYDVTASKRTPIGPSWMYFLIILIALLSAWRFEGGR